MVPALFSRRLDHIIACTMLYESGTMRVLFRVK